MQPYLLNSLRNSFCVLVLIGLVLDASADVSRIDIHQRSTLSSPDTDLRYQVIEGVLHFALDPIHVGNQKIVDVTLAPLNDEGLIEYSADFRLLVPDTTSTNTNASDTLLYSVNNRGGSRLPPEVSLTHPLAAAAHTYLATGWINELPPAPGRLRLHAPVVGTTNTPVTGEVRYEIIVNAPDNNVNIAGAGHLAYAPIEQGLVNATLTQRNVPQDDPVNIPRGEFSLTITNAEDSNQPMITLNLNGDFQPGVIYELRYEAQDPVLAGAGLSGIRDIVSLLRYGTEDTGMQAQLSALGLPELEHSIAWGYSQSGRLLRQFVYQGFNEDLQGRVVFDGVLPVIAGGGFGMFNMRFAMPTRTNGQHESYLYPNDFFPFTYGSSTDPFSGRTDGILNLAQASGTAPKVMHIQTGNEYWIRGGSLPHTDPAGTRDADIPDTVRFYTIGGSQHSGGNGMPGNATLGQLPANPNVWLPIAESLLASMVDWVSNDHEPPPSIYPRIADGTLVASHLPSGDINPAAWNALPGINHPTSMYQVAHKNFGEQFYSHGIVESQPDSDVQHYTALVPAVGEDNNELSRGTLLPPLAAVPLGTFISWNLRAPHTGAETALARLMGAYLPFAATGQEAQQNHDPRPAISTLYENFEDYLQAYETATDRLIEEGYLLAEFKQTYMDMALANRIFFQH